MKFRLTNTGEYPLVVNVYSTVPENDDGLGQTKNLETKTVEVGDSLEIKDGERLGRVAELTPTGEGRYFDAAYAP